MLDSYLASRSRLASYREFIASFLAQGLQSLTLREIAAIGSFDGLIGLRHDVDHHMERAWLMGVIEKDMGVRATYFLLPPGDYDKDENYYGRIAGGRVEHNPAMLDLAHKLMSLGHEIGLHNDFLQLSIHTGRPLEELFADEIEWFAQNGIQITGSAAHGSTFAAQNKISNYEIFSECVRKANQGRSINAGGKEFPLNSISMAGLGLSYEAYFIGKSFYVADSGGRLTWPHMTPEGKEAKFLSVEADCPTMISNFHALPYKGVQALIHADHWQFSGSGVQVDFANEGLDKAWTAARALGWRPPRPKPAVLPAGYLESFLVALSGNPRVQLHHFGELEIPAPELGTDPRERCLQEAKAWAASIKHGSRDPARIHVFVQYNSDLTPGAVNEVTALHRRLGIPYSLLTFARWTNHSAGREEPYPLDWAAIAGDVSADLANVGYLHNALHLASGDVEVAINGMDADIAALSRHGFDARVFQPWGSWMPSADMPHPVDVDWWKLTRSQPLWIYNRIGLSIEATYSDASIGSPANVSPGHDPVPWCVEKFKPGGRYLLMLHPNLYDERWRGYTGPPGPDWFGRICAGSRRADWDVLTAPLRAI